jgi:uncharacterized protein (DUF58 family)
VTGRATPKLGGYVALSAAGLLAALVLGRPELVALAAPFLFALAAGLVVAAPPRLAIGLAVATDRAVEGDVVAATATLAAEARLARVDLVLPAPAGVSVSPGPVALALRAGERRELPLELAVERWGAHRVGPPLVRVRDPLRFLVWDLAGPDRPLLRTYPGGEALRRIVVPRETQALAGNEVARPKGEGIEFADIRLRAPGDPLRRVNWRASARRGELWVNESHPERNADVVLFVDSFAEARLGRQSTLDLAVRATAAVADVYARRRDRVGFVGFGGVLRWLAPGAGAAQLYRVVDGLLDTEIVLSYYWKEVDVIPRRALPPNALVLALTPLLDRRSIGALLELRARGVDLAVIDVSPLPFARASAGEADELAFRLWTLRREVLRHRLQRAGIAVAEWLPERPLQAVLEEVNAFRRSARHARV